MLWSFACGVSAVVLLLLLWAAARVLIWAWWTPRRLERALRQQGLDGTTYRFLHGDLQDNALLIKEARSKPMPLSHDIAPRVVPLFVHGMHKYGKLYFTWSGPVPRVIFTDPVLVREVLSNKFGHFSKPKIPPLARLLMTGLINHEGEKWAKHRRIVNPAFHMEKLKLMLPAFAACCSYLVERWENSMSTEGCWELDVWPEFLNFSGDVISRTAFGSSYEEGKRIFQLINEEAQLFSQAAQRLYIPGYRFLPTSINNRRKAVNREVRALLKGIIEKRVNSLRRGEASNDDLLGLLMKSNAKEYQEHGNKNDSGMSMDDMIGECKLFYFAGHETTTVLLTWTMIVLSMHPSWQEQAREEVLRVFGKNTPDFDGLAHLKIVTMILYEVLRLYPPAVSIPRQTYKTIKLGNVTYPPGVLIAMPIILTHRDKKFWGEDADEFRPERFAQGVSKASKDQVAFFPFGGGPRTCLGMNFALLEAKMGLSMILQSFSFELSPSYIHAPQILLTLQPQHGAQLRLHRL
ncbi:Cytochrome P450 [Canna indica]|uniref:Cytochrome P450 n=1 Tax=Canna indica TaxID=4628 RepID=A0AAQ3JM03_9LILI|nr:Cytochrome P450 [Canna indica]